MTYPKPRREHTLVDSPTPRVPPVILADLQVKAAVARVHGIEARRRADQLQADLDAMAARVTDLEQPPAAEPAVDEPSPAVVTETRSGPAVDSPADASWLIDTWRTGGWEF